MTLMAAKDGNALFEKLSRMTREERSRMFFDCWYNFFDVSEAFNSLLEWDDETCEYVEKLGGFEDKPECEKLLTTDEMKQVIREAIQRAWDADDHWDRVDFIQREMQGGICNILKKKVEGKQGNTQEKGGMNDGYARWENNNGIVLCAMGRCTDCDGHCS